MDRKYPDNSLEGHLAAWERLLAGANANRDDLSVLEPYRGQIEALLAEVQDAYARRESLETQKRQATEDLHRLFRQGRDLVARYQSGARLVYGKQSPKLSELGMKPGRPRKAVPRCGVQGCPLEATATAK
jgi:chromosome segregation ATPase